jgi:hypothetical protein
VAVPVTITGVNVVEALVVLTALPNEYQFTESKLPCNWTDPALTPALDVTTMAAIVLSDRPSRTDPPPVELAAVSEVTGASPEVPGWTLFPKGS